MHFPTPVANFMNMIIYLVIIGKLTGLESVLTQALRNTIW